MQDAYFCSNVSGMTCRPCEDTILETVLATQGVIRASVSYWNAEVKITYDPDIVSEQRLREILTQIGYPPCEKAYAGLLTELLTAAAVLLMVWLLPQLPLPAIPQAEAGASLLFLFFVGLVTGTHCICMCGGILLSQTSSADLRGKHRPAWRSFWEYQAGRLTISTALGALFGAAGGILRYSTKLKSMIFTLCGIAILFIGLCMWGIFPMLRRVQAQIPSICRMPKNSLRMSKHIPFIVGVLNGLLPCAASGAMWLYAASSGSLLRGAVSMLVWCLGTLPLMSVFTLAGRVLPQKGLRFFERISVILMLAMGMRMTWQGLCILL